MEYLASPVRRRVKAKPNHCYPRVSALCLTMDLGGLTDWGCAGGPQHLCFPPSITRRVPTRLLKQREDPEVLL